MRRLLIALADRQAGFAPVPVLERLERSQNWSRERLDEWQLGRLRELLEHAGRHVPFYRELFAKTGFDPAKVESLEQIGCLPTLDKTQIMQDPRRFVSEVAPEPRVWLRTSGSTGVPFRFVRTRLAQSYKIASRLRFRRWFGIERVSPQLIVAGIPAHAKGLKQRISHWLHFAATHRVEVYASELAGDGLERAARLIERHRVESIMGYPTGIAALADHLSRGRPLAHRPRAIFTNSETLSDAMRQRIVRGFGVMPRADYVATEGSIAHECPEGGLHVDMEETLLEVLPTADADGLGQAAVTFLHTHDFPLIRYRIGDVVRWASRECPCGRGLATLDGVVGRFADAITLPGGRSFTAANINMRIAHLPCIEKVRQYQIVQRSEQELELRILEAAETDAETVEAFMAALGEILAPLRISVVRLPELPREAGGKFRPVIGLGAQAGEPGTPAPLRRS